MSTQEDRQKEVETLRQTISELHSKNDIDSILEATRLQTRIRDLEKELTAINPLEDYYMKNMDLLMDYYKKQD
jgi:hypothetical protein